MPSHHLTPDESVRMPASRSARAKPRFRHVKVAVLTARALDDIHVMKRRWDREGDVIWYRAA